MLLFENNDKVFELYQRGLSFAVGKEFAQKRAGVVSLGKNHGSEQLSRRRELLAVEEKANKDKIIQKHGEKHFLDQVKSNFHRKVSGELTDEFENKESFHRKYLEVDDAIPTLLELLSLKAASINRITPLVAGQGWLADELINLVNKPQYRKRADVKVSDSNLAVSYVGLDNLKLVIPTFVLKHWLPHTTAPYPLMKRKLWNESLSIALTSRALAKQYGVDWYRAFCAGMLSNVGHLAVTRCVINKYNDLHAAELKAAFIDRDKRLHNALLEIDNSPEMLLDQLSTRSFVVAADLIERMQFDRLPITEAIFDLAYCADFNKMSKIAQIVAKAKSYVVFRNLAKEDMITNEEAKLILANAKLTADDISLLKKTDIDHLKLNFT